MSILFRTLLAALSLLAWGTAVMASKPRDVFAHVIVGNTWGWTASNWEDEMQLAKGASIDGFVLNVAVPYSERATSIENAFTAAESCGFKLFFSFDYASSGAWNKDDVISILNTFGNSSAHYKVDGAPFVSTFEGPGSAADWPIIRAAISTGIYFVPDWTSIGANGVRDNHFSKVDGGFSWDMWPAGANDMNTGPDLWWQSQMSPKAYMMGVSPWFYTDLPDWGKAWVWRGDSLWHDRWQQVLSIDPDFVQIVTWNDYGEGHYIGPIHDGGVPVKAHRYVDGMPHDAWLESLDYYISAYKNQGTASVSKEKIVFWYRLTRGDAGSNNGVRGNAPWQPYVDPAAIMNDNVFVTAFVKSAATVHVYVGATKIGEYSCTTAGACFFSLPYGTNTGAVTIYLVRGDATVLCGEGEPISAAPPGGLTNFNAWVGSIKGKSCSLPVSSSRVSSATPVTSSVAAAVSSSARVSSSVRASSSRPASSSAAPSSIPVPQSSRPASSAAPSSIAVPHSSRPASSAVPSSIAAASSARPSLTPGVSSSPRASSIAAASSVLHSSAAQSSRAQSSAVPVQSSVVRSSAAPSALASAHQSSAVAHSSAPRSSQVVSQPHASSVNAAPSNAPVPSVPAASDSARYTPAPASSPPAILPSRVSSAPSAPTPVSSNGAAPPPIQLTFNLSDGTVTSAGTVDVGTDSNGKTVITFGSDGALVSLTLPDTLPTDVAAGPVQYTLSSYIVLVNRSQSRSLAPQGLFKRITISQTPTIGTCSYIVTVNGVDVFSIDLDTLTHSQLQFTTNPFTGGSSIVITQGVSCTGGATPPAVNVLALSLISQIAQANSVSFAFPSSTSSVPVAASSEAPASSSAARLSSSPAPVSSVGAPASSSVVSIAAPASSSVVSIAAPGSSSAVSIAAPASSSVVSIAAPASSSVISIAAPASSSVVSQAAPVSSPASSTSILIMPASVPPSSSPSAVQLSSVALASVSASASIAQPSSSASAVLSGTAIVHAGSSALPSSEASSAPTASSSTPIVSSLPSLNSASTVSYAAHSSSIEVQSFSVSAVTSVYASVAPTSVVPASSEAPSSSYEPAASTPVSSSEGPVSEQPSSSGGLSATVRPTGRSARHSSSSVRARSTRSSKPTSSVRLRPSSTQKKPTSAVKPTSSVRRGRTSTGKRTSTARAKPTTVKHRTSSAHRVTSSVGRRPTTSVRPVHSSKPTTVKHTTRKHTTVKHSTAKPTTIKHTTLKPTTVKPTTVKPTPTKPASVVSKRVSCPKNDGDVFVDQNTGKSFRIECGVVYGAGQWYDDFDDATFRDCIEECATRSKCVNVSFKDGHCYLKKRLRTKGTSKRIWSAVLIDE